jgi:hypothetical protein
MHEKGEEIIFLIGPGALLAPLRLYADVALYAAVPRETVFCCFGSGEWPQSGRRSGTREVGEVQTKFLCRLAGSKPPFFFDLVSSIDFHDVKRPSFVEAQILIQEMKEAAQHPFRIRSLFMPGVWGGHRLQHLIPGLPKEWPNCAWGFDLVAPENTVNFDFADTPLWVAFDLFMYFESVNILGLQNQRRFGNYFPIRFELSTHVNCLEAKAGDLFMIPAGTVHCSGANNLVLEISATLYINTFKIYDYLRPDLNGLPRPISYHRAFEVIDFQRTTDWVHQNLVCKPKCIAEGDGWRRFLLSKSAFFSYSVERIEMSRSYKDSTTANGVHVLCVVEGKRVWIVKESDGSSLDLSYAETGIVPAACGAYRLESIGENEVKVIKCFLDS